MNITIEPIEEHWLEDLDHVLKDQIREIEKQRDELLEALINSVLSSCRDCEDSDDSCKEYACCSILNEVMVIEKAYGKNWAEIMESRK